MVRIPGDMLPPKVDRSAEPLYALPWRLLLAGWLASVAVGVGGWFVAAAIRPLDPETVHWGALSGAIGAVVGGLGLLIMVPWRPRRSGDLAPLWMASTVARILALPAVGILLYFAARPPERPLVIGLAGATLVLLAIEVPIIATAMLRQLTEEEAAASRQGHDQPSGDRPSSASKSDPTS